MFDKIENLHDLLEVKLQGLYDAENQLVKAMPQLAAKATDLQLRQSLDQHLRETENQVARLEQVAKSLGMDLNGPGCKAMEGIIDEANMLLAMRADDDVRDAAIISAAQGVEHYEIAQYGTVVAFARRLGYAAEAGMLADTLTEEKTTNDLLTQLAEAAVNEKADS
jgi:ferritin-like metal-binding protein YciE